jgi:NAD(P)-dependent dehydrogenase (short-subunit alcohol dehydrogenase family)
VAATSWASGSVGSDLAEQTVVVIGGSSGIGLETARRARSQGARIILTGRDRGRLDRAAAEVGASSTAAFDATRIEQLEHFLGGLPEPVDHVMVTAGSSYYSPLADMDFERVRQALDEHVLLPMQVARGVAGRVRSAGTVIFMTGTGARRPGVGLSIAAILAAALPAVTANLALELAPVRVNLIAAGFVDTPLSASLLGGDMENRCEELTATLPVRRVIEPADVAALAIHIMTNSALTGATYDIDGGEQLLPGG